MPVWITGGNGKISDHVISQNSIELEDLETGWLYMVGYDIPDQAFLAGENEDDEDIYIGRAIIEGDLIPGIILSDSKKALFTIRGQVCERDEKHILCGTQLSWANRLPNQIHPRAVIGGRTSSGELLYIGKTEYDGIITIGKIGPSVPYKLFIPINGTEVSVDDYEVLIHGY